MRMHCRGSAECVIEPPSKLKGRSIQPIVSGFVLDPAVLPGETGQEHDHPGTDLGNQFVLFPAGAAGNRSQFGPCRRGEAANQSTRQYPARVPVFVNPVAALCLPRNQAVCRQCCGRHPVCPRSGCQGCPAGHRMHQMSLGACPVPRTR